jgi:5-hydroxyisourate hydrolase
MKKLSTHVLDTAHGIPAAGMSLTLWRDGQLLATTETNAEGRTDAPLLEGEALVPGIYEIIFSVGDYFRIQHGESGKFLGLVPIRFEIEAGDRGYHIPLLCSPWSYSTYRGS